MEAVNKMIAFLAGSLVVAAIALTVFVFYRLFNADTVSRQSSGAR